MLNLYRLFMRIADNYAPQFRVTLLYTVLSGVTQSLAYLSLFPVFIALDQGKSFSVMLPWLCVLVLLVILQILFKLNESEFTYRYWHKLIEEKRLALGKVLYQMPLLKLKQYDSGDLVGTIGTNVMTQVSALSQIGTLFVQLVTIPAILVICSIFVSWQLGLLLVAACVLLFILFQMIKIRQKTGLLQTTAADTEATARTIEYIQGLTVFKATGYVGKKALRLQQAYTEQRKVQHQLHDNTRNILFSGQIVLQVALVLMLLIGSILVYYHIVSLPAMAMIVIFLIYISEPLSLLFPLNQLFADAQASQLKIDDLMAQMQPEDNNDPVPITQFDIQFNHVQFAYQQQPVLRDINLTIQPNTITGLVGASGSGKTTLTQLIAGFIHPDSGDIKIGGIDITQLDSKHLLSYISIVYQEVWLFNDTIKNNILMGNPQATDQQVYQAARAANIHDFILSLPEKYDTLTGDIGAFLSGGEKQRISIARAILKNAPLVILDEPTSSLDSESEYQVQQALEALVKNKTVIVVAHRLSTVKGANNIVVLENGHIIQQGNHQQLIAGQGGLYQRLWQAQHAGD